jgi:hypothetical protein
VNATTTVKGALPFPSLVPDAIVCGLVDRVNVPELQVAFGVLPPPGVALLQVNLMALIGTDGQLAKELPLALTLKLQAVAPPFMLHLTVAVVFPLTGVVSGSGELNVIVEGVTVTLPVTENGRSLSRIFGSTRADTGRFDAQSAARQTVDRIKHAQIVSRRSAIGALA